uniref:TSA: Wollemia nobilis Ref_Wollemi_Transcript_1485_2536 transcribed RNA sequence n=1 Tax=Wollemia nobilis TaxID=56998 RepID=A0A0C9RZ17_9CONI
MAFISGVVVGFFIGIAIVVAFVYSENTRAKRRSQRAVQIAALSRLTVEDTRKLLPKEFFPPWVVFSEFQKLNWLNHELVAVWPFVDKAASQMIKAIAEPVLEQYRPAILSSLTFSKLTLGTVAPQFTGVKIVENGDSGITMELELQWDGNPSIILNVKTLIGVALPIQVKNVAFTGLFRLIFKPLTEELPCFGALTYSLREKKKLDFTLKVVGGDISSIPGLDGAIEETIKDAVEDSLMWPVRKVIPIVPGDYSDLELHTVGILQVKLVQAKGLLNKDFIGKSDPFAVLYIRPKRERMKKSKTISNQLNPIWNEQFEFEVEDIPTQHLTIKIYDEEGVQAAEILGCAQVPLKDLQPGNLKDICLPLVKDLETRKRDEKYRGEVHLELIYNPLGMENGSAGPYATGNQQFGMTSLEKVLTNGMNGQRMSISSRKKKDIVRGVLTVTVKRAEDLTATDLMGKADPYVVLNMKKTDAKKKTRVIHKNLNPEWNQTFDFMVEDAMHDMLILEVWDHDMFSKDFMGKCALTLTKVLHEGEYDADLPLDGVKSGRIFIHLKWTPQPISMDSL